MRLTETQLRNAIRALLMTELFVSPKKKREKKLGMGANIKRVLDREPRSFSYGDPQGGTSYDGFGEFDETDEIYEEEILDEYS